MTWAERKLTSEQKIDLLQKWQASYQRINSVMEALHAVVGVEPESQLHEAVWKMFSDYTRALESQLGNCDGWLTWYCDINKMGRKGLHMQPAGRRMRPIRTLEDLVWLIEAESDKKGEQ